MSDPQILDLLEICKEAALTAGKFLAEHNESSKRVNKDLIHDVKIEADIQSEKILLDFLSERSSFSILSEEVGLVDGDDSLYRWIIDPVDGSLNYSRNLPMCCVSIGLWKEETPVLGVIYDFNRGELFSGAVGIGAWVNDEPIKVSTVEEKGKAILMTGFPVKTDFLEEKMARFVSDIQLYKKVRLIGSAALSIAYVAAGRAEAYHENNIMLWDVAGGIPLVLGSGGNMWIEKTSKLNCLNVRATNARVNE